MDGCFIGILSKIGFAAHPFLLATVKFCVTHCIQLKISSVLPHVTVILSGSLQNFFLSMGISDCKVVWVRTTGFEALDMHDISHGSLSHTQLSLTALSLSLSLSLLSIFQPWTIVRIK